MGKRFAIVIGAAAASVMALGAQTTTAAPVQQLSCGDTITTDTTLHKDLVDCPTRGIVIDADNVTLDLNGHTIDGDGQDGQDSGVSVFKHDGITVKNGSIRQFGTGFDAFWSRHIRLLGLATSGNQRFGIELAAAERILVQNCSVDRSGAGLLVTRGGSGGAVRSSDHVRIVNSSFRDNAGTGIAVNGSRNVIARNRVSGGREGILISQGRGNLLAGNVVAGAATSIRIIGELEPGRPGAVDTVVRGNRLRGAKRDGVLVDLTAKDTLLRHNSARHSQGDGFDVNDRSTKLSRNRAVRNHDLGIEAVRGVNDGGGNVARRNGDPRQCINVVCSR